MSEHHEISEKETMLLVFKAFKYALDPQLDTLNVEGCILGDVHDNNSYEGVVGPDREKTQFLKGHLKCFLNIWSISNYTTSRVPSLTMPFRRARVCSEIQPTPILSASVGFSWCSHGCIGNCTNSTSSCRQSPDASRIKRFTFPANCARRRLSGLSLIAARK